MALTSTTGTVIGDSVTFINPGKGISRGEGIMAYIDYTLGAGDSVVLSTYFKDETIKPDFYQQIVVDNASGFFIAKFEITIGIGGKFRLPIPAARGEEEIKLQFAGLVDGDINVEFAVDKGY